MTFFTVSEPTPLSQTAPILTAEEFARSWRDSELQATDYIVPLSDHPQRAAYMTFRTALRDWPASEDFPDVRPELETS